MDNFDFASSVLKKLKDKFGNVSSSYNLIVLKDSDGNMNRYYTIEEPEELEDLREELIYLCQLYELVAFIDLGLRTYGDTKLKLYKDIYTIVKTGGEGFKSKHQKESIDDLLLRTLCQTDYIKWQKVSVIKCEGADNLRKALEMTTVKMYSIVDILRCNDELCYLIVDNTSKSTIRKVYGELGEIEKNSFIPLYGE